MRLLAAENPHGPGIIHNQVVDGSKLSVRRDWHKARSLSRTFRGGEVGSNWNTGSCKGGFCDGMILA